MLFADGTNTDWIGMATFWGVISGLILGVLKIVIDAVMQGITLWRQGTTQTKLAENTAMTEKKGDEAKNAALDAARRGEQAAKEAIEAKTAALLMTSLVKENTAATKENVKATEGLHKEINSKMDLQKLKDTIIDKESGRQEGLQQAADARAAEGK